MRQCKVESGGTPSTYSLLFRYLSFPKFVEGFAGCGKLDQVPTVNVHGDIVAIVVACRGELA